MIRLSKTIGFNKKILDKEQIYQERIRKKTKRQELEAFSYFYFYTKNFFIFKRFFRII
jgi:hypothetical protein